MNILNSIVERKREEISQQKRVVSEAQLESRLTRSLRKMGSLSQTLSPLGGATSIVAEIKRASPSKGVIDAEIDPPRLSQEYVVAGAKAISVLTDGEGFGGSLKDLQLVRASVEVPLLRKDFILDRYQLLEACCSGADAVLLIVAALDDEQLKSLHSQAISLDLEPLVEVHTEAELKRALAIEGVKIVGINHRDLTSFTVDLGVSERLIPRLATLTDQVRVVVESGIETPADIARLRAVGAANFLIGESLIRALDKTALLHSFMEVGNAN